MEPDSKRLTMKGATGFMPILATHWLESHFRTAPEFRENIHIRIV